MGDIYVQIINAWRWYMEDEWTEEEVQATNLFGIN